MPESTTNGNPGEGAAFGQPGHASQPETSLAAAPSSPLAGAVAGLCLDCGLCCNGVLFGSVRVREDELAVMAALPGSVLATDSNGSRLDQPCPAWERGRCGIYAARPRQCQEFHCALLRSLADSKLALEHARQAIRETRRQAALVQTLLRDLGDTDTRWSLSRRCERALGQAGHHSPERWDAVAELMLAVHTLTGQLRRWFYEQEGAPPTSTRGESR